MKRTISKVLALCIAVALLIASFSMFAFAYSIELLSTYAGVANSANKAGFWFDAEDLTVSHDGYLRGAPYVGYLRDHSTPKHITGNDGNGPFWGVDSDSKYHNYMNFNPGSYHVHDYYIGSSYHVTMDVKLDSAFVAGHFAALRLGLDSADGSQAVSNTSKGISIAFDVADATKDTIKIGAYDGTAGQVFYTVDLAEGSLSTWKTVQVIDNNAGVMKVYYDNTLISTVTLSSISGNYYTAMSVADAYGATQVTASNVSVCKQANVNIGVAANSDGSIVTTGGLHVDNYGIVGFTFDATVNNPLPGTNTGFAPAVVDPAFAGASLTLSDGIAINYYAEGVDANAYVMVDGEKITGVADGDKFVYSFGNFGPQQMGDEFTAELYVDDAKVDESVYSVKAYCDAMLADASSSAQLVNLLKDLLNYGAAAQDYRDYNVDALVNSDLSDTDKDRVYNYVADSTVPSITTDVLDPTVSWKTGTVYFGDTVNLAVRFEGEAEIVKVTVGDKTYDITEFETLDNGYRVVVDVIGPHQFRQAVKFTACNANGIAISGTLTYGIGAYAANKDTVTDPMCKLVKALMVYGDSAAAYVA